MAVTNILLATTLGVNILLGFWMLVILQDMDFTFDIIKSKLTTIDMVTHSSKINLELIRKKLWQSKVK